MGHQGTPKKALRSRMPVLGLLSISWARTRLGCEQGRPEATCPFLLCLWHVTGITAPWGSPALAQISAPVFLYVYVPSRSPPPTAPVVLVSLWTSRGLSVFLWVCPSSSHCAHSQYKSLSRVSHLCISLGGFSSCVCVLICVFVRLVGVALGLGVREPWAYVSTLS